MADTLACGLFTHGEHQIRPIDPLGFSIAPQVLNPYDWHTVRSNHIGAADGLAYLRAILACHQGIYRARSDVATIGFMRPAGQLPGSLVESLCINLCTQDVDSRHSVYRRRDGEMIGGSNRFVKQSTSYIPRQTNFDYTALPITTTSVRRLDS